MTYVVAIDAGTTGVRALVVDEKAQVVDVAYRELTQYFPQSGWVEHDPIEIWDAVSATLAEVGARLHEAGRRVAAIGITNQRETLVAFDRRTGQPLHRAIVWQDRRTADLCAEFERGGHLPLVRETTGLVLDPYFTASKITYLLRHGELALGPDSPDLAFGTVDSW
ncbi:MAG TPA: FGGY family carbohydrate kinase, partial [Acidimicrobiales bacterium]